MLKYVCVGHKKVIKPKKPLTPPTSPTPNNNLHRTTSKTSIHSQPSHRTTSKPSNSPTLHRTTSKSSINSQSSTLSKRSSKFNINKSSKTPQVKKWQNWFLLKKYPCICDTPPFFISILYINLPTCFFLNICWMMYIFILYIKKERERVSSGRDINTQNITMKKKYRLRAY